MNSFKKIIYLSRDKESNWELQEKANKLEFQNTDDLLYIGYEVALTIEIFEDGTNKVLIIEGIDVSDKNISI